MKRIDTVIIGGGQAGLAMSRCLVGRGIDHVVLERGRVAERWRSERWDSLRLLTPNWMSRLPSWSYRGSDPDGFMSRAEVIDFLDAYAASFAAPVETGVRVLSVLRQGAGYRVVTTRGEWRARCVVLATGACDRPSLPEFAATLDPALVQIDAARYRRPDRLPQGGVLVVGASASGLQLAAELQASGRPVTLAVGRHTRLPRRYRGRDILAWLDDLGILDDRYDQVGDLESARRLPSLQLVGSPDHRTLDLAVLAEAGVRLVGRVLGADVRGFDLDRDLAATLASADERLGRCLARIDAWIRARGLSDRLPAAGPVRPVPAADSPGRLDWRAEGIRSVVWATGFRRDYTWLQVPVFDANGEIRHDGGVTAAPGLYALGLPFLRRRKSTFLDGVGGDAAALSAHLERFLERGRPLAAPTGSLT